MAEEFDFGDNVDVGTFEQILDMDDGEEDDGHEFSRSIVFGFLEQAETTFNKMDQALEEKDLRQLSELGHYLKGSSATLGFTKVKDECEKIQHWGARKDETGSTPETDDKKNLKLINESLTKIRKNVEEVNDLMVRYYKQLEGDE